MFCHNSAYKYSMDTKNIIPEIVALSIGRDKGNDIVVDSPTVSRQHAHLTICSPSSFILEDCGSKRGIFVEGEGHRLRITRKLIDIHDKVWIADVEFNIASLVFNDQKIRQKQGKDAKEPLDFTTEFAELKKVYEDYPELRKACRERDKLIRLWSVVGGSVIGVGSVVTAGAFGVLSVMSSAGLSILVPTLASHLLSTEEKLELIDKEFKQRYRCPNPECHDPFGNREYALLAKQKKCPKCKAVWVK